jgi:ribokinase
VGAVNWDITLFTNRLPHGGEEVVVNQITQAPGGKAGNTAVAAARLIGRNRVAILAGLGNDVVAKDHVRIFDHEGVITSGLKFSAQFDSGQAYIAVDEFGENAIYTYFGANAALTPDDLDDPKRQALISQASVVTLMDPPFETAVKLAIESKKNRKRIVYDPGVKSEKGLDALQPILNNADYLIVNESEIHNLTGSLNLQDATKKVTENYPRLKIIQKFGGRGSNMFEDGGSSVFVDALDLASLGMRVINTVGCGDSFLGAFVAALVEGLPDLDALRWATCAAGIKATKPETRGSPDRETMFRYLDYVKLRNPSS